MPTGGGGGSGGRAGDIRAGGAVWEISAKDNYSAALNRAAADTKKWSAQTGSHLGQIGEGFNKITSSLGASGFAGQFSNALSLGSNAALGLQGAIVTFGAVASAKIGVVVSGLENLNAELEKGDRLSQKLVGSIDRIRAQGLQEAQAEPSPFGVVASKRLVEETKNSLAAEGDRLRKLREDLELIERNDRFGRTKEERDAKAIDIQQARARINKEFGTEGALSLLDTGIDAAKKKLPELEAKYQQTMAAFKAANKELQKTQGEWLADLARAPERLDGIIDKAKEFVKAWTNGNKQQSAFGKIAARNAMVEDLQQLPGQVLPIIGGFQQFLDDWTRPDGPLGAWGKLAAGLQSGLGFVRGGQGGGDLQAMLGLGDRFERLDRAQLEVQQEIKQEVHKLPPAIANEFAAQFKIK